MSERIVAGVRLSNPDKILYPEQGITKGSSPIITSRWPSGCFPTSPFGRSRWCAARWAQETKCFYQRHAGSGVPEQLQK
jgi:bifunctional non-homologous end joining protein LigD